MFTAMLERIQHDVISQLSRLQFQMQPEPVVEVRRPEPVMHFEHAEVSALAGAEGEQIQEEEQAAHTPFVRQGRKIGRNEPCPCGSGKKYKHCHGRMN